MRFISLVLGLACSMTTQVRAAEQSGWLDVPRQMRAQTRLALKAGDWEAAWRLNEAGRALQPGHSGLIIQAVQIADKAADAERLLRALKALADAGSSIDIDKLKTANRLPSDELTQVRKDFATNKAPVGSARPAVELPLPDALIESVAFDPETGDLYLGSVMERTIYRVNIADPGAVEVFAERRHGLYSAFGMKIDRKARVLYAATATVPQTPLFEKEPEGTALLAFALKTGTLLKRHEIAGAKQMADVTVSGGAVYVTDSRARRIYKLSEPAGDLSVFSSDPRFTSLQGIAPLGDDFIVADYAVGLWRVNGRTGQAVMVRPPQGSQSLIGLDGLAAGPERRLFAVRNGVPPHSVLRLTFSPDGRLTQVTPELRGHPLIDEPTLMTISGKTAYLVARSQWPLFPVDGSAPKRVRADPVILTWPLQDRPLARRTAR